MSAEKQSKKTVFGRTLMSLRKAHRLTQEQVADILKIKRSTYAYYESETTPTLDNIKKLATLFNVSVHFLLFGEEENIIEFGSSLGTQPAEETTQKLKLKDLSRDEAQLIVHYRLLSSQNKEKIHKEAKELFEKSF